jgi:hypothetical protein
MGALQLDQYLASNEFGGHNLWRVGALLVLGRHRRMSAGGDQEQCPPVA